MPAEQAGVGAICRIYVYYRVRPGDRDSLMAAFAQLSLPTGLSRPQLMQRVDEAASRVEATPSGDASATAEPASDAATETWMEVWTLPTPEPAAWRAPIEAAALDSGLTAFACGSRHVECFLSCA